MKNKIKIFCVFLCCLILVLSLVYIGYSKYKDSFKLQTNTQIAKPILEIIRTDLNKINVLNNDKYYYEFSVRNFNDSNEISAVRLKYNIEFVLSQEDAPVVIDLYKINDSNEIKIELENNKTIQYETFDLTKKENMYRAEISYNENLENIMNDNLEIKLNIQTIQVEEECV